MNIYYLNDIVNQSEKIIKNLKKKDCAIIGRGKSQRQFWFDPDLYFIIFLNDFPLKYVKEYYGEDYNDKVFPFLSFYHFAFLYDKLIDRGCLENKTNILSFQEKEIFKPWHISGNVIGTCISFFCHLMNPGKNMIFSGIDFDDEKRKFEAELNGVNISHKYYKNKINMYHVSKNNTRINVPYLPFHGIYRRF